MTPPLHTSRLRLEPVGRGDADAICALLWLPEARRYLCDDALLPRADVEASIADSLDPGSITAYWRIGPGADGVGDTGAMIGIVGIRPPTRDTLRLRAIGWRSLELIVALDPRHWGRGYAHEAVEAVAVRAGQDGVTFALVAGVDVPNARAHGLMHRCGFQELGRVAGPAHEIVVYERPL